MSTAADTPDAEGTAGAQAPQDGLGLGRVAGDDIDGTQCAGYRGNRLHGAAYADC